MIHFSIDVHLHVDLGVGVADDPVSAVSESVRASHVEGDSTVLNGVDDLLEGRSEIGREVAYRRPILQSE